MNCEVARQLLLEKTLSGVDGTDADASLDQHLLGCPDCRDEGDAMLRLSADLPAALLTPASPDAALRARLLDGTRHGRALPSFAGGVARLFDLTLTDARALLTRLEQPSEWRAGFVPGNWMRPVKPGAALGPSAIGMILRTTPGVTLPAHVHDGPERTFVLQGGYRDSAGTEVWAGELHDMPAGGEHSLHVLPPAECIAAVLVHGGVRLAR
jgi:hypothetical protein